MCCGRSGSFSSRAAWRLWCGWSWTVTSWPAIWSRRRTCGGLRCRRWLGMCGRSGRRCRLVVRRRWLRIRRGRWRICRIGRRCRCRFRGRRVRLGLWVRRGRRAGVGRLGRQVRLACRGVPVRWGLLVRSARLARSARRVSQVQPALRVRWVLRGSRVQRVIPGSGVRLVRRVRRAIAGRRRRTTGMRWCAVGTGCRIRGTVSRRRRRWLRRWIRAASRTHRSCRA